ncbi:MAG: methyltransferase domain-containing protein [Gemmatimonadota bacterium]|nr:MAG: methyltransferase domain-containing protein [Gemmatimonadota bacterium]
METDITKSDGCQHLYDQQKFFTLSELKKQNYRHFLNEILRNRHLFKMLPANISHAIDVGCGTGYLAYFLARKGKRVTAVDMSSKKLQSFRDIALQYNITQVHSDLFQLRYTHSFDVLICQEVLEHLEHYEKAVSLMKSFLRPRGFALFCVPYEENLTAKMRTCPLCHASYHKNGHLHSFNRQILSDVLERQDLTILRTKLIVSKRVTKWFAKIKYPAWMGFFGVLLFDNVMNHLCPRKAAYLAVLCRKNS